MDIDFRDDFFHTSCFDFREIEDIVHELDQRFGAIIYFLHVSLFIYSEWSEGILEK